MRVRHYQTLQSSSDSCRYDYFYLLQPSKSFFKDALSHNDLNGLVLDEIYILWHINRTTKKKKTNDCELNQEILFLMGSKHDKRKFIS